MLDTARKYLRGTLQSESQEQNAYTGSMKAENANAASSNNQNSNEVESHRENAQIEKGYIFIIPLRC